MYIPYRWFFTTPLYFATFADWDRFRENCNLEYDFFAHVIASYQSYVCTRGCVGKLGQAHFAKILFLKSISLDFRKI